MARDHYVAKVQTKPWEHAVGDQKRQLTYFDFSTGKFDTKSARNLFSLDALNSEAVEKMLCECIEDPIGKYLEEARRDPSLVLQPPNDDWRMARAFALLHMLAPQRLTEARGLPTTPVTLEYLAEQGDGKLDVLASAHLGVFRMSFVTLPHHLELFFPEGGFPIPFPGGPALALPLSLNHVLVMHTDPMHEDLVQSYIAGGVINALSVGVSSGVQRVVVPPGVRALKARDEALAIETVTGLRADCERLVDLIGEASAIAGLPEWYVTRAADVTR